VNLDLLDLLDLLLIVLTVPLAGLPPLGVVLGLGVFLATVVVAAVLVFLGFFSMGAG
jgi:uncharacterized membrane protein YqaE (UPF0057 family)